MFEEEIQFILEVDKMKSVDRRTYILNGSRRENDAEHSFHIALMAFILAKYADRPVDPQRVSKMLLVHDLVEIDAGDTFAYDKEGYKDKEEREMKAAKRIFALLEDRSFYDLWREFEDMSTDDALFANGLDRLQPMLLNYYGKKSTWEIHGIKKEDVLKRLEPLRKSSTFLWKFAQDFVEDAFKGK